MEDFLGEFSSELALRRLGGSRRSRLLARVLFGLLGAVLCVVGALHFASRRPLPANRATFACMLAVFLAFACFWLFNVALSRKWRWPLVAFAASFVGMIVTRIAFGA